jgi:hypothetical protein
MCGGWRGWVDTSSVPRPEHQLGVLELVDRKAAVLGTRIPLKKTVSCKPINWK